MVNGVKTGEPAFDVQSMLRTCVPMTGVGGGTGGTGGAECAGDEGATEADGGGTGGGEGAESKHGCLLVVRRRSGSAPQPHGRDDGPHGVRRRSHASRVERPREELIP